MQKWSEFVLTDADFPASGATVTVYLTGTTTKASIYSDDGVTVAANPQTTNSLGFVSFFVANNNYDINYAGPGITTWTRNRVALFDPFEASVGDAPVTFKGTWTSGSANPATTGVIRLASADAINFRNNANSADISGLAKNSSDVMLVGGVAGVSLAGGLALPSGQVISVNADTGLSRGSGGTWAVGNGTQGDTTGNLQLNQITKYNGISTVANGVASEVAQINLTGQTAAIGLTTFFTPAANGIYRITFGGAVTATGTGINVTPSILVTDGDGNSSLSQSGNLISAASGTYQAVVAFAKAATAMQYQTTIVNTGTYTLRIRLEWLG